MKKLRIKRIKNGFESIEADLTSEEILKRKTDEAQEIEQKQAIEYIGKRNEERGSIASQLEYIAENGIEAFIARDSAIRKKYPKK